MRAWKYLIMLLLRSIFCYLIENAKFNVSFMSKLCASECFPASALHKRFAKCRQPVKQRELHRNKWAFHFLPSRTASPFCLPVFSSASFPFKLHSKANWFNSRFSVENVLRWVVITFSWKFFFFILKTRAGTGAFNHLSSIYKSFNLLYPFPKEK